MHVESEFKHEHKLDQYYRNNIADVMGASLWQDL